MKRREVLEIAKNYVNLLAHANQDLRGAYLSGSVLTAGEGEWPESSDVDVVLVFRKDACPKKIGKLSHEGVLLEATCMEETEFSSLSHVLSTHYLAYAMNAGEILLDRDGRLGCCHLKTAAEYGKEEWVTKRIGSFLERIEEGCRRPDREISPPQRYMGWIFSTGISCFPILAADLQNCTVRKRYPAVRRVLEHYGMGEFYGRLLGYLAPRALSRERLLSHLLALLETFSLTVGSQGPSRDLPYRGDISEEGEAVAIRGSRELILGETPMDALFWMGVTFCRCQMIFLLDDEALYQARYPAFQMFFEDLGVGDEESLSRRFQALSRFLPELAQAAEKVRAEKCRKFLEK